MIDRIFGAALTFSLLLGGTLAIGSAMFGMDPRSAATRAAAAHPVKAVQLERVVVVGKRLAPGSTLASNERGEPRSSRLQ